MHVLGVFLYSKGFYRLFFNKWFYHEGDYTDFGFVNTLPGGFYKLDLDLLKISVSSEVWKLVQAIIMSPLTVTRYILYQTWYGLIKDIQFEESCTNRDTIFPHLNKSHQLPLKKPHSISSPWFYILTSTQSTTNKRDNLVDLVQRWFSYYI